MTLITYQKKKELQHLPNQAPTDEHKSQTLQIPSYQIID